MSTGVDPTVGFIRETQDVIFEELNQADLSIFGEAFDLSPQSPDIQRNGILSEILASLWEQVELSFWAFDPAKATEFLLDALVELNGIKRDYGTPSFVTLKLTGVPGTIIDADSLCSNTNEDIIVKILESVTIEPSGFVEVIAFSTVIGDINIVTGDINTILTPKNGWSSVTNEADGTPGTNKQTDAELRVEREKSVATPSQNQIDSLVAHLLALQDVRFARVIENRTLSTVDGVPGKAFETIILGGDDTQIANQIWLDKPGGIEAFGSTTIWISDSQGYPQDISFSRPTDKPIYVVINTNELAGFPVDGAEKIKQAIVDYANGDLVVGKDFSVGDDIIQAELYCPANSVSGHSVQDLFIGFAPAPAADDDLVIGIREIGTFDVVNIVVNVTPLP